MFNREGEITHRTKHKQLFAITSTANSHKPSRADSTQELVSKQWTDFSSWLVIWAAVTAQVWKTLPCNLWKDPFTFPTYTLWLCRQNRCQTWCVGLWGVLGLAFFPPSSPFCSKTTKVFIPTFLKECHNFKVLYKWKLLFSWHFLELFPASFLLSSLLMF